MSNKNQSDILIFTGICLCFLLSGFAALLYQTAWMRQFSVVFGTSELAVATVLAAYMAGLALGSALAAKYIHKVTRPILYYGILEGIIAISAILVPWLLTAISSLYIAILGGQPEPPDASGMGQPLFYLIAAFVVLVIPTAAMGATLPMLTRYAVKSEAHIGSRVGLLYAINTLGAIGGTLTAAFLLLPALGLSGTLYSGAAINIVVFIIAVVISRGTSVQHPEGSPAANTHITRFSLRIFSQPSTQWILPIMLVSGVASFTYEVLWTRLLSHSLGGSVTAFATMLASFLSGIALGSAAASRLARSRDQALICFVVCQLCIGLLSIGIYMVFDWLAPTFESTGVTWQTITLAMMILFPATFFIGATFPFAVRIVTDHQAKAPASSAQVYAWNTIGSIAGATLAGFILIPSLKYEGTIKMAVLINLSLACISCLLINHRNFKAACFACLLLGLIYQPSMPENILRMSPFSSSRDGNILFYEVGRSSTVLVLEQEGFLFLRNNGLPEAATDKSGGPATTNSQAMLATFPAIIRPDATDLLVIGFGGGVVLEAAPPNFEAIDVIELESKVIDANAAISDQRRRDPLSDKRIAIKINDARNALALTNKKYDAIASQPSHPWTAGASHLFTQEFAELVARNLKADGVFIQWMNLEFIDRSLFQSMTKSLKNVYRNVRVYQFENEVIFFVASNAAIDIEKQIALTGEPFKSQQAHYLKEGLTGINDIAAALVMDENGAQRFSLGAPAITDNHNLMATGSARVIQANAGLKRDDLASIWRHYSPLLNIDSWLNRDLRQTLDYTYIANRLKKNAPEGLVDHLAKVLFDDRDPASLRIAADILRENGNMADSEKNLITALQINPDNHQARYSLVRPYVKTIQDAPDSIKSELQKLTGSARATAELLAASISNNHREAKLADATLAEALATDVWYLDAVKIRVAWRNMERASMKAVRARESLEIIDQAIALHQDFNLYGMRFAAAFLAGDIQSTIETGTRINTIINTTLDNDKLDLTALVNSKKALTNDSTESHDLDIEIYKITQKIDARLALLKSMLTGLNQLNSADAVSASKVDNLKVETENLINQYEAFELPEPS